MQHCFIYPVLADAIDSPAIKNVKAKDNIHEKELKCRKESLNMNEKKPPYESLRILSIIFVILVSIAAVMPASSKTEIHASESCADLEDGTWLKQQSPEDNVWDQLNCLPDSDKLLFKLFILGIIDIDELSTWVLGVNRRLIVLKTMHEKRLIQASDIADSTDRSLQNISYAMRELEKQGLIKCLTPDKHTWKKYIPTEKGTGVFEKLKKNHLID